MIGKRKSPVPKKKKGISKILPYYLMVLPGLIYLFINNYLPMFGIIIAFKKINYTKGIFGSDWSGFDNFRFLFGSKDAWSITRNTIGYNIVFFIMVTVCAILLAICINEIQSKLTSQVYQIIILLPFLMSWVVISYLAYAFLSSESGFLNKTLFPMIGLKPINWYQDKTYWPIILIFVHTWRNVGYSMIIYFSSIVGISQDYFEAARIDGASKLKQIRYITIPLLKPTVITLFILSVGQVFRSDFGLFYQVTRNSGPLYEYTRTIDVYVYQALMKNADYGMSGAASVYQSICGFIIILIANKAVKKYQSSSALF
ncbi:ABC transporter permease [Lacrimispora sp. 38-1]|uniref:ABC transporter permease n=1 Tax=Lacrimispora sp. 38-1 TaxID=3125778 RepID=UPI003CF75393